MYKNEIMDAMTKKFGYKNVVLTKSSLKFDGGLSGSFEGMGD